MAFAEEREQVERALEMGETEGGGEPEFPPVAQRFLTAREARGLTQSEVAAQWGEVPSMYWDLEFHDSEAFDVISVQDLVTIAAILRVTVMHLLFGGEPPRPLPGTSYADVVRKLSGKLEDGSMSVDQLSDAAGWELAGFLANPEELGTLPIYGLRRICLVVGVDWATTLANPKARIRGGC